MTLKATDTMDRPRRVALPWYRAEDYETLRARLTDGAKLPERHGTWLFATEQVEQVVQRSGVEVVRMTIDRQQLDPEHPLALPLSRRSSRTAGPSLADGPKRTREKAALTSSAAFFSSADFERALQPTKV